MDKVHADVNDAVGSAVSWYISGKQFLLSIMWDRI